MKNKKWFKKLIFKIFLGSLFVKLFSFIFSKERYEKIKKNFDDFVCEEKREINELVEKKQSFGTFVCDSFSLIKEYFIPCSRNDYRPKILRARSLITIALVLLFLKIFVFVYIFLVCPYPALMNTNMEAEIFKMINQEREKNNLAKLELNPILSKSAEEKARDMLSQQYFSHYGPDGKEPWEWINKDEYLYIYMGENLAMNFSTAESAHKALMDSYGHRKNILNDRYEDIGLAIISGEFSGRDTNILVQFFGHERSAVAQAETPEKHDPQEAPESLVKAVTGQAMAGAKEDQIVKEAGDELTDLAITNQLKEIAVKPAEDQSMAVKFLLALQNIYFAVALLLAVFLSVNIFVKIKIQRKSVIIDSLLLLVFIGGLAYVNIYVLNNVLDKVLIL